MKSIDKIRWMCIIELGSYFRRALQIYFLSMFVMLFFAVIHSLRQKAYSIPHGTNDKIQKGTEKWTRDQTKNTLSSLSTPWQSCCPKSGSFTRAMRERRFWRSGIRIRRGRRNNGTVLAIALIASEIGMILSICKFINDVRLNNIKNFCQNEERSDEWWQKFSPPSTAQLTMQ